MRREFDHLIYTSADNFALWGKNACARAEAMRAYREKRDARWS